MDYSDYILIAGCCVLFSWPLVILIWRITCHFKKTCTWKKCPYRHHDHMSLDMFWMEIGCDKFPPTPDEIEEDEKKFDQLEDLIRELDRENKEKQNKK